MREKVQFLGYCQQREKYLINFHAILVYDIVSFIDGYELKKIVKEPLLRVI